MFSGSEDTIEQFMDNLRAIFNEGETTAGFPYAATRVLAYRRQLRFHRLALRQRRAAWRIQFMTRAFAAGVRKVCVMDASDREQAAVRGYVATLPRPFPIRPADTEVKILRGRATTFRHSDGAEAEAEAGQVWVLWAVAGQGDAQVDLPVVHDTVTLVHTDGSKSKVESAGHRLTVNLKGDRKMAPPVLVIDRPVDKGRGSNK